MLRTLVRPLARSLSITAVTTLLLVASAGPAAAQFSLEATYGVDRNIESRPSERDGFVSVSAHWSLRPGLSVGIGSDLQFEDAAVTTSDLQAGSVYASSTLEAAGARLAPFVRAGIGVGRAPCEGDTCSDGLYLRASTGLRVRLVEPVRLVAELGASRVSRPFAAIGASVDF